MNYDKIKSGTIVTDGRMTIKATGPCKGFWFPGEVIDHAGEPTEFCYVGYESEWNADFFHEK